ncbi:MAG TPA: hypothetical protein VFY50_00440, partial [Candidatus Nitrosocosmicus sp.]|nr:hypothetical protein [Candidatus Nitrosocosmicus sp.]
QANEMMLKINTAYGILSDPHKRKQYDYSISISKVVIRQNARNKSSGSNLYQIHRRLFPIFLSIARVLVFNTVKTIKSIIEFVNDRIN